MPVSPADLVLSCQLTCRQRSKTRPTFVIKVLRRPVESALLASWATSLSPASGMGPPCGVFCHEHGLWREFRDRQPWVTGP
jgi:hypothetical protein